MEYLDWITGFITLIGVWLIGKKWWVGQAIQLVSQGLWLILIYERKLWGLVPLEIALIYLYAKNAWDWYKEEHGGKVNVPSLRRGIRK